MRRLFYLVTMLAAGALLSSCNWGIQIYQPTAPSVFEVNYNTDRLEVGPEAQEQIIRITSDLFWYATLQDGSWCTLGQQSYINELTTRLSFKVEVNTSTEPRIDSLIVISGNETRKLAIVQNGIGSLINTDEVVLHGTLPIEYTFSSIHEWSLEQSGDWFSVSPDKYSTGTVITFAAKDNNIDTEQRVGSVTFTVAGITLTIPVKQVITETIIVSSQSVELESQGGEFSIRTLTNVDYTVSSDADWIQGLGTRALNEFEEYFTAETNMSNQARTGHITFQFGDISETVTVTQAGRDPILDITTPGFYGVGNDYVYRKGIQTSRYTSGNSKTFRFIYPSSNLVLQLSGIPTSIDAGDMFVATFTAYQNGSVATSDRIDIVLLGEDENLIWLKCTDRKYFIFKKQ